MPSSRLPSGREETGVERRAGSCQEHIASHRASWARPSHPSYMLPSPNNRPQLLRPQPHVDSPSQTPHIVCAWPSPAHPASFWKPLLGEILSHCPEWNGSGQPLECGSLRTGLYPVPLEHNGLGSCCEARCLVSHLPLTGQLTLGRFRSVYFPQVHRGPGTHEVLRECLLGTQQNWTFCPMGGRK